MFQDFELLQIQSSSALSVYNHYNRVRANLSILEQNELGRATECDTSIDRMSNEVIAS